MKTISHANFFEKPSTRMKLVVFFLENPTREFYESEVRKKTGLSLGAVNKYLKELASEKILLLNKRGKMNFYMLNKENTLVKHLKITHNLSLPIIKAMKRLGKKLDLKIYLYGSVSRGEDVEDSDWDFLILGNIKSQLLEREMKPIRKHFSKKIKLSLFTKNEWLRMNKTDPAFYERVNKDKIEIA